ncbi:PREDICTED: methyl-CpG-binding domain-containing protein 9-like [Lupinus angustifolius]|uniref:methyl-CpG-binding domain-containing protein 9-like n=1 Tax=Lupinus angustifolius TaxID=3871 RepID=UPI00092FB14B|nr:PREDICTED: methyl-CpG-binding domain-containing protein 9-like [Lupinus angustifolius]
MDSHPLRIDLNQIPSPSTFLDTIDVVRAYHQYPAPPSHPAALLPRGSTLCAACSNTGTSGVHAIVCDACERGFHVHCVGVRGGRGIVEWLCGECVAGGVKSKLWPLGVKSKQLLDINASPPSDVDGEELQDLRKHTVGDNPFGAPVAYSNLHNGCAFGFQKASGVVTHAVRVGSEDIRNHTQSLTRSFEEGLRDFISERCGVLEEGWRVEFRQSVCSSEVYAVYRAPDGKEFDSLYEVACYLGVTSGYNSMESEIRNDKSGGPQPSRKRKSTKMPAANCFAEKWGTLINSYCKDPPFDGLSVECAAIGGNIRKGTEAEIRREEDGLSSPEQSSDGLPLQFKDFFVLSLGKVDGRLSYHDVNLIYPVGYKSSWHDKITGSLFTCEVLEGGESGPIFRIRRCSCSKYVVPVGSTILSVSSLSQQFVSQTNEECERKTNDDMDHDGDESIQMILSDPCVPTENDVMSCIESFLNEALNTCTSDILQPVASSVQDKSRNSLADDSWSVDDIGEILVEERSSSSAWGVMSQKLVNACKDICKKKGILKFYCKHVENETCFNEWDARNGRNHSHISSLDKFCGSIGSVSIPDVIHAENDLDSLSEELVKWIGQDRFGLDVEFVQEILEQLHGVQDFSQYELLNSRSNSSSFPTVENGFLVVEQRGGSQYQEEEAVQDLYRRSKKARPTAKCVKENRCPPPPGKPLCSRVPNKHIGDIFQAWELIERFHEILDLKEPLLLDELEKELINPWFDGLEFVEKCERETNGSQVLNLPGGDGNCRSPRCELGPSGSVESSHAFIQVETEAMKQAAQAKLASFTYARCFGVALTKTHNSLLRVLIGELQSKVAALVDPSFESGETRSRRGRRKDIDIATPAIRTKLNMLPNNELTWPELARRYILAVLSMDGNLDSAESTAREGGKVFRCLQGDGGLLCGSLSGVAGIEADALLLADATKKIFGSLSEDNNVLTIEEEESDVKDDSENLLGGDDSIPEWAIELEPARKLPTNVGTRIRRCVYNALEKNPPEWAKKILEHSISKEVYKGNASGPTKKAVLSVLATVAGEGLQKKPPKKRRKKTEISISDIVMKQCRVVLRRAAAADDSKVFCNLLGRKLTNSSDNDDEGLLGSPAMVARPLDFRTIDLRLAAGAYGGSHEAFVEDVRELWNNVRVAFGDQPDLVELAENLSQNFEWLYKEEVVAYSQKFVEYAKLGCLNAEMRKEVHNFIASTREIPKAPWDEGVCKVCGIDRDDDSVLLCDTCDAEYHTYCLNPPLARIPEGNWYCPSCVVGKRGTEDVTERKHIICKRRRKRFRGEVNSLYLESLTHLSAVMEEKEYWEYSTGERTFLLKFLCDELLNSFLIRHHLEQCAELSVELQQKLRAFYVEWKGLKAKEAILSTKAAKIDTCLLSKTGEVVHKEGFPATLVSVTNSDTGSQSMSSVDVEGQHRKISAAVESECIDKFTKSSPSPNHMDREINDAGGADHHILGNHQKCEGRDISTIVTSQQGQFVPVGAPQIAVNEAQPYHVELNATRREISTLQDSIASVQSQLLKLPVRREFLGSDSIGQLYWASALPRGHSCIVVDASDALLHGRGMASDRDSVDKFSFMPHSALTAKDNYKIIQPSNALGISSPWVAYETDGEIEELLSWLNDKDAKEKELKVSIMLWSKSRFHDLINAQTEGQVEDQGPFSIPGIREKILSSLVMKATSLLEKKYGPFFEWDTIEVLKKLNKKARNTNDLKMYRCECLEPIWPSRKHCIFCHKTFLNDVDLEGHNDGKCNAGLLALEKNKDSSGSSKGRGNLKCGTSSEKFRGDADTAGTSINGYSTSNLSSSLIKFSNEGFSCPFNLGDICSKFATNDSNKELVREIGLIGSDGHPSFVPSISPFVSDSTVMLFTAQNDDNVVNGESKGLESQVSQGSTDGAGRLAANESNNLGNPNTSLVEHRDGKSSFPIPASDMGVDGCCVVPSSSLRPLVGNVSHILRQLKINLLDMDAALPKVALKRSKVELHGRQAWHAFVKSAQTIYEMVQAIITFEDMIKTEYLRNDWWYWSSFSAAAKSSTLSSLALRLYSLDSAIIYEKLLSSNMTDSPKPSIAELKQPPIIVDADKSKATRKSNRKRKESDG